MRKQIVFVLAFVVVAGAAQAADFAARKQLLERSMQKGLGVDQVPLLRVAPGRGRDSAMETLRRRFASPYEQIVLSGKTSTQSFRKELVVSAPGWNLEVSGDGRKARYRNVAYLDGRENVRVPVAQRPKQDELEAKARRFIGDQLREFIRLGRGEELVALYTEYQVSGGGSTASGAKPVEETVGAANVIFGRTIDGVHVIGPGSKVRVMFGSNGTIAGFDFDWPEYTRTQSVQRVVPLAEVRSRVSRVDALNLEKSDVKIERMECGYLDLGSDRRDSEAPLQSACAVFTVQRQIVDAAANARNAQSGHIMVARVSLVPAGEKVEADSRWSQALRFLGRTAPQAQPPMQGPKRKVK